MMQALHESYCDLQASADAQVSYVLVFELSVNELLT